jgi:outer membrane receptor protein involved in Fe transport
MRVQSVVPWIAIVGTLTAWSPGSAASQQLMLATQAPRFFFASSAASKPVEIDVSRNSVLAHVVSLHLAHGTIGSSLAEIQRQTGLTFAYDSHFPATRPVSLEAESITVAAALGAILVGTGVDVVLTRTGHVWLVASKLRGLAVEEGAIIGRVTDKQTGDPLIGATVTLESVGQSTITGSDGQYRFVNLSSGNYLVRARYIGYKASLVSVTVSAGQEVTVDFRLEKSAQQLEEVVTTGTVVPTEVKALPNPVSVISAEDIGRQRPQDMQQLFRAAIPTGVSWDRPTDPYFTAFSTRGASTLAGQVGQMKVFVDGMEAANINVVGVDPASIQRMEVIRGPQAAAIYGSDAIGGVIQIFTKRGNPNLARPHVEAEAALGIINTPYDGFGGVLRQHYQASIRGGLSVVSYNLGLGYSHTDDYIPNGELSRQSNPSVYGGVRFTQGIVAVDLSGRYYVQNNPVAVNPALAGTGFVNFSKPFYQPDQFQNQAVSTNITVAPTRWWQQRITVGVDRYTNDYIQAQPRLRFPGDTLLLVLNTNSTKTSVGYNTSLQASLGTGISGSMTVGVDHYSLPVTAFNSFDALNTTGDIRTPEGSPPSISRTITNNTGYFAQAQLGFREVLFVTAGLRAEENTNFGDSLGTPISPRLGLSYVHEIRSTTVKLRGSWGGAIRAPTPGQKLASVSPFYAMLSSPNLGPERQQGWDTGLDVVFGSRGSLNVTYYDQRAKDLIQLVTLQFGSPSTVQYQNVGRVHNSGVEVEAKLAVGVLELRAQYGYTRARIQQLAPGYAGDLRVGDQTLLTPEQTGGASVNITPFARTTFSAGLTYVGSWNNYDYFARYSCLGGTGPCRASNRDYIIGYPGFTKFHANVWQQITPLISGFVSVDNLTNNKAYEIGNISAVMGRIATAGVRMQY